MVMIMLKPKVSDYIYKPRMQRARKLHQLYLLEHINIPSVEDIVLKQIRITKKLNDDLGNLIDKKSADDNLMELCMLIDVDLEDVDPINYDGGFHV